jgi:hypothetical protein
MHPDYQVLSKNEARNKPSAPFYWKMNENALWFAWVVCIQLHGPQDSPRLEASEITKHCSF